MLSMLVLALLTGPQAPASDAAVLFDRGVTWDDFLANATAQRMTWRANADRAAPPEELVDRLKRVSPGLKILVIAEPACTDSVNTVPYLAKLAFLTDVPLRIIDKATGTPIVERHRTPDGRTATPTVVLIRDGVEAGVWVERPAVLQTWYLAMLDKIPMEQRTARKLAWYDWDRGDTTLSEIVVLAEKK
ncbi:MAG TPA: thioredoxin family protein [Vicinamibacterales bacterium]|nr:thioredoxin family protein [Vicinamibacterales bacterium]